MSEGDNLQTVLNDLGLSDSDVQAPAVQSALRGRAQLLGGLSGGERSSPMPYSQIMELLNNTSAMAKLGKDRLGLERLGSVLGLKAFTYIAGFWNYFPTSHYNAFKFPPVVITSYSLRWRVMYWVRGWPMIDPALLNAIWSRKPYLWRTNAFDGAAEQLGYFARKEGIHEGITVPVFSQGSEVAIISLVPSVAGLLTAADLYDLRFGLSVFAEAFHETAFAEQREKTRKGIRLTPREQEVMQMIVSGLRNVDIAKYLKVSESAVQKHQEKICHKFRITSRNDIPSEAIALGFTALSSSELFAGG